nr:hypothetical protein [uncultured Mediterranean phage uvMED]
MTTAPSKNSTATTSTIATDSAPWTGRSLDVSEDVVREYTAANSAYKAAEARWKQAQSALKHAHAEGLLDGHYDERAEVYEFDGVTFSKATRTSWPMSGFSDELQALHKKEKDDGTATPNVSEYLRAKFSD